jgi:Putative transposase
VAKSFGFSLHAGVSCEAHQREVRERVCRYIPRPAVAEKRITVNAQGGVYPHKTPYRDGTTHVLFEPLDFIGVEPVDPINPYFRSWPNPDLS